MVNQHKDKFENANDFVLTNDQITDPTNSTSGVFDGYTTNDRETFSNTEPISKLSSSNNSFSISNLRKEFKIENNQQPNTCSNKFSPNKRENKSVLVTIAGSPIQPESSSSTVQLVPPAPNPLPSSIPVPIKKKSTNNSINIKNKECTTHPPKPPPLPPTLFTLNSNQITYSLNKNEKITIKSNNQNNHVRVCKSDKEDIVRVNVKKSSQSKHKPPINRFKQFKSSSINELDNISGNDKNNNGNLKESTTNFSLNDFRKEFKKTPKLFTNHDPKKSLFKNSVSILDMNNNANKHSFYSQNDLTRIDKSPPNRLTQVVSLNKIPQCKATSTFYASNCRLNKPNRYQLEDLESDQTSEDNSEFENLNISNLDSNKRSILSLNDDFNNNFLKYKIRNHLEIIKKQNDYVKSTLIQQQKQQLHQQQPHQASNSSESISSSLSSVSSVSKPDPKHDNKQSNQRSRHLSAHEMRNNYLPASNLLTSKPNIGKSLEINISNEDDARQLDNEYNYTRRYQRQAPASINFIKSSSRKPIEFYQQQPIRSTLNGVTLSSVDTLYDIDDEYDTVHVTSHSPQMPPPPPQQHQLQQQLSTSSSSQPHVFSVNDYKIMYEIIRKIKPYINNCIKLEVRNYFEKYIMKEHNEYLKNNLNNISNHYSSNQ